MDACQDKKKRNCTSTTMDAENLFFFRKDSHINVTEILIKCFWNFLKDFVNKGPLMSDFFFI